MKTEKLRKGEVENGKEKTAKMRRQKIEKTIKSVRDQIAFDQIEKMRKSNPAERNFDEQTKKYDKSNSAQKMKGEKTAETRERRIS